VFCCLYAVLHRHNLLFFRFPGWIAAFDCQKWPHWAVRFALAVLVSTGTQRPAEVSARMSAASTSATNAQLTASNQRIADSQTDSRVAANVAKDLEASRAERCKKAREVYQTSINSQRLYRNTADGKREFLSEAELAQQRIDSAKAVESICGPQG
jgi:hypothetical protein